MKKSEAVFYQNAGGNEPVREWLLGLDREDRKSDFYREARVYGAASRLHKENAKDAETGYRSGEQARKGIRVKVRLAIKKEVI